VADKNIALMYFSGTNVTHTYAEVIRDALIDHGCGIQLFNVTAYASRQGVLPIDDYDWFIFGFPVFSDFAPSVINEWLGTLDGKGKRCTQYFTYGARTTGYSHFHTMQLLDGAGFKVMLSAEFLGRHSFNVGGWKILPDRPDERDFVVAREFAGISLDRFNQDNPAEFNLQKPLDYGRAIRAIEEQEKRVERGPTNPVRIVDDCSMCRDCETECPTQAFNADSGLSEPSSCIECMRCVYICPDEVIEVDKRVKAFYGDFLAFWNLTEDMMKAKRSKIISDSTQTAF